MTGNPTGFFVHYLVILLASTVHTGGYGLDLEKQVILTVLLFMHTW
jgi:hypothetical protein